MLPPNRVCKLAPIDPTILRERTTIPRTMPRFCTTRWPGSSKAVVTLSLIIAMVVLSGCAPSLPRWPAAVNRVAGARHPSSSLPRDRHDELAPHRILAVFPQVDALPRAQAQRAMAYRHGQLMPKHDAAHMRGHVIRAFRDMLDQSIAIRGHALGKSLQIAPHLGIGIFSNAQAGTGMAQEQVADSDTH